MRNGLAAPERGHLRRKSLAEKRGTYLGRADICVRARFRVLALRGACALGCKASVRKHAATLAVEAVKTYNCASVQRDMTVFEMAKPIT